MALNQGILHVSLHGTDACQCLGRKAGFAQSAEDKPHTNDATAVQNNSIRRSLCLLPLKLTMRHLQHPLLHVLAFTHHSPAARARGVVQIAHGALLHDIDTARCAPQHAVGVNHVGVRIV